MSPSARSSQPDPRRQPLQQHPHQVQQHLQVQPQVESNEPPVEIFVDPAMGTPLPIWVEKDVQNHDLIVQLIKVSAIWTLPMSESQTICSETRRSDIRKLQHSPLHPRRPTSRVWAEPLSPISQQARKDRPRRPMGPRLRPSWGDAHVQKGLGRLQGHWI